MTFISNYIFLDLISQYGGLKNKRKSKSSSNTDTDTLKLPNDYKRDFFIYRQEKDIYNHKVKKEELFEGSQKRFIYWVEQIQK